LGPRLEVVRGADQLGHLLMHTGCQQASLGRVFTDFAPESERTKIEELFRGVSEEDEGHTGFLSVNLRDTAGLLVRVQITHACLGMGDERVHVVGIKEEQDEGGLYDLQTQSGLGKDICEAVPAENVSDSESSSSESNATSEDIETAADAPETEIHVSFHSLHRVGDCYFPIVSCSPAFKALLHVKDPSPGCDVSMRGVFRWEKPFDMFDTWATDFIIRDADDHSPARFKWLVFPVHGCRSASMSAKCSMSSSVDDTKLIRLTLHELHWFSMRNEETAQRPEQAPRKRHRKQRTTGSGMPRRTSGTPRSQGSAMSLVSSNESRMSL